MDKSIKTLNKSFACWIADQELPVVIAIVVLVLMSWGIYPLMAR